MQKISTEDIELMDQRFRAVFINSLSGYKSLNLVGTKNRNGLSNLAPFNSIVHLGANPALIGMIVRPKTESHQTLDNIESQGYYTLNQVSESFFEKAHQCSARYDEQTSEFEATGLHEHFEEDFPIPYVYESLIRIGLKLMEIIPIDVNKTFLVIGKVQEVYLEEAFLAEDGFVDIEKAGTITCSGLDSYYRTEPLGRLSYAKPNKLVEYLATKPNF